MGETPENAVRREIYEELALTLQVLLPLGPIDHVWFWKGREVRERAWVFIADSSDYPSLNPAINLELIEADGQHHSTLWRVLEDDSATLPPICPAALPELLRSQLAKETL